MSLTPLLRETDCTMLFLPLFEQFIAFYQNPKCEDHKHPGTIENYWKRYRKIAAWLRTEQLSHIEAEQFTFGDGDIRALGGLGGGGSDNFATDGGFGSNGRIVIDAHGATLPAACAPAATVR